MVKFILIVFGILLWFRSISVRRYWPITLNRFWKWSGWFERVAIFHHGDCTLMIRRSLLLGLRHICDTYINIILLLNSFINFLLFHMGNINLCTIPQNFLYQWLGVHWFSDSLFRYFLLILVRSFNIVQHLATCSKNISFSCTRRCRRS